MENTSRCKCHNSGCKRGYGFYYFQLWSGGGLVRIKDGKASFVWQNKTIASHHSDPFIIDGFIYSYSGASNQNKGSFKCVELETGTEKWSTNEMGWSSSVYADGHLLCQDIKGNLFLMKPDPNKFVKVSELRKALGDVKGPVWTKPVVANGFLYLRFKQRLVCYEIVQR